MSLHLYSAAAPTANPNPANNPSVRMSLNQSASGDMNVAVLNDDGSVAYNLGSFRAATGEYKPAMIGHIPEAAATWPVDSEGFHVVVPNVVGS